MFQPPDLAALESTVAERVRARRFQEALELLDAALALGASAAIWNDWATVQHAAGHSYKAEQGYRRALQLDGKYRDAAVNLGLLLLTQNRTKEAAALLDQHTAGLTEREKAAIQALSSKEEGLPEKVARLEAPPPAAACCTSERPIPWAQAGKESAPVDLKTCSRILVIKLDCIGDFILATPFLRGLRLAAPHAHIDLMVWPAALPLAELCPYVDRIVGTRFSQSDGGAEQLEVLGKQESRQGFISDYANHRYDLAVIPRWDRDIGYAALICRGSQAPWRVGFSVPQLYAHVGDYAHENLTHILHRPFAAHDVEHNAALLRYLRGDPGIVSDADAAAVDIWVGKEDMDTATRLVQQNSLDLSAPVVAICPGASGANRRMPAVKLLSILRRVEDLLPGVQFLVLGCSTEQQTALLLCSSLMRCSDLCGRTTIREMAALLSLVTVAVSMDSGPAHIAAATDTSVLVFSPHPLKGDAIDNHSPTRFRPWGRGESIVLQPENAVWPCQDRCRGEGPNCILAISDEVSAQAILRLAERALNRQRQTNQTETRSQLEQAFSAEAQHAGV